MLCATTGPDLLKEFNKHDILKDFSKQWKPTSRWKEADRVTESANTWKDAGSWKSEAVSTRNIDTTSWVNELRGTEQEKLVEKALNLDLNNLSEKQLIDIFIHVTDEPECKAQKYLYEADNNLLLAFQTYFDNHSKRPPSAVSPCSSSPHSPPHYDKEGYTPECREQCSGYTPEYRGGEEEITPVKRNTRNQRDSFSKDCDHRCCMVHAEACCTCSDSRPARDLYDIYIKNEGYCITPYRWLFYCPVCKRRTQADSSPDQTRTSSFTPLYRPKVRQRTCSKHTVCPPSCSKSKETCVIC